MTENGNHPNHPLFQKATHSECPAIEAMQPSTHQLNVLDNAAPDAMENAAFPVTEVTSRVGLNNGCAMYTAAVHGDLAENLPEGTVFQIMPNAAVWTIASTDSFHGGEVLASKPVVLNDSENPLQPNISPILNALTIDISDTQPCSVQSSTQNGHVAVHSEGNITDIDLSFLNGADDEPSSTGDNASNQVSENSLNNQRSTSRDIKVHTPNQQIHSNLSSTGPNKIAENIGAEIVMVDLSKPIQLSQNSLIIVDGKKCVLQQDSQTGKVIAYPVAEPDKPKKKRGRPKKIVSEMIENHSTDGKLLTKVVENISDNETVIKKGLLEVVNADGTLVRRSSRKRKRTRLLKDYETGNLNQEIGSDLDDAPQFMKDDCSLAQKKARHRNVGQTKKDLFLIRDNGNNEKPLKGKVGRPRKDATEVEQVQSFLIQTADGQQLMIQVPLSSIPPGISLQDVAQDIADKINFGASHSQNTSSSNGTELLSESTAHSTALNNETTTNNSSMDESLSLHADINYPYTEINICSDTERETKELHLLPGSKTIDAGMQFHPPMSSSEINSSCNVTNPSVQSSLNEFECALAYSTSLTGFNSSCVSKLPYSARSEGTELVLSIPEVIVKEHENSSHSADDNFVPTYLNPSAGNSPSSRKDVDGTSENDHLTDIGVSEEVVYSSSIGQDIQELDHENENKNSNSKVYQNNICTSDEKVDMLFLQSDDQIIPLSGAENINTIDADSAYAKKNRNIKTSVNNSVGGDELFLQNSNVLPSTSISIVSENHSVSEQSVCNYFFDDDVQKSSNNCVTFTSIDGTINNCNIEVVSELQNNEIGSINPKLEVCQTTSVTETNSESYGQSKKMFSVSKVQSSYENHFTETNLIDVSQDETIIAFTDDKSISEDYILPTSPLKTCSVSNKKLPSLLPKSSDNSEFTLETYQCSKCAFQTVYDFEYQQHIIVHAKLKECKKCQFVYNEEEELIEHYKKCHPRWICTQCNYMAELPSAMKQHINKHKETGCLCVICGKIYKDQYILKMHVKLVHLPAEILFKCHLCEKQFNRKAHLKRHLRIHGPDKPFKCSHCDYRGCEKSDITKHMLIHEEPKHECEYCGKAFRHIKNKELHIKRHKNQRDYKCGVCEFFGYTFTDVRKHIEKVHTNSKFISCNKCSQVSKSSKLLQKHQNDEQCETLILEQTIPSNGTLLPVVYENVTKKSVQKKISFKSVD